MLANLKGIHALKVQWVCIVPTCTVHLKDKSLEACVVGGVYQCDYSKDSYLIG